MHFVCLFIQNERNITTSLLMIHLKYTVVHYVNLNSSPINKPYLRSFEYVISIFFFDFLFMFFLTRPLSKFLKTIIFNRNFQNSFQDVEYNRILGWQTL